MKDQSALIGINVRPFITSFMFSVILAGFSIIILPLVSAAQDDPADTPPPPLKLISKDEKARLAAGKDDRERNKIAIELLTLRLMSAEKLMETQDFEGVFREFGGFQGLLDDHLNYLIRHDNDSGRALDNFKRFEMVLRSFTSRIEAIRRDIPPRFEPYVRSIGKYVRDARSRALEPLFSDTVIREPKRPNN